MKVMAPLAARLIQGLARMYAEKWNFLALFAFVFALNVLILGKFDLLPTISAVASSAAEVVATVSMPARAVTELPLKIEIPSIALTASIANPDTTDTTALDNLLLKGAVRYPTSAKLGETGNVVLFAHSSYLPVVGNSAYKTFNGIQKLRTGETITVYAVDTIYTYTVKSVSKESANDAGIPLSVTGKVLTLSTCDSFGAKTDRFVVVADFVESHALPL